MAALTAILAGVSSALGIGSGVKAAKDAKKSRRQQEAQYAQSELVAREAAALKATRVADNKFKLGTDDYGLRRSGTDTTPRKLGSSRTNSGGTVGGLFGSSNVGGL